jgi:ATP-dependent Clp protease ATP-binding subunit ClpA
MRRISNFLEWYFVRVPISQLYFAKNISLLIEDSFGVLINLRYYFAPYYHDTSYTGRILSIIVRTISIVTGLVAIIIFALIFFLLPIFWVLAPLLTIYSPTIIIILLLSTIYYALIGVYKPKTINPSKSKPHKITDSMSYYTLRAFELYPSTIFWQELAKNSKLKRFIIKSGIPLYEVINVLKNSPILDQKIILSRIFELSQKHNLRKIRIVHLFSALVLENLAILKPLLQKNQLDEQTLQTYLEWDEYEYNRAHPPMPFDPDYLLNTGGGINRDHRGIITPILDSLSIDYTAEASNQRHEMRLIRLNLIQQIENILQKSSNANIILLGEDGVGKESLIWEISQLILSGNLHGQLWGKRIVGLNISSILSANTHTSHEALFNQILNEINRSGNIILYINNIVAALESQKTHGLSIFALLQEPLSQQRCHIILSCTPEEYSRLQNEYPLITGLSETINITETNLNETLHITHLESLQLEAKYNIIIPYPIIKLTVQLAQEFIFNKPFPEKAVTLLENTVIETSHHVNYQQTPWGPKIIVQPVFVSQTLSKITDIPTGIVSQSEAQKLLQLEDVIQRDVIGQKEAIHAIVSTLQRNRAGIRSVNKPIGTFLFAGPTGVGKTHVAKMLAKHYYGDPEAMIRLDMSEFQTPDTIHRLTSREAGSLTEKVRQKPFSLILLDELEKADHHILDVFLQILDDARLTDQFGNVCKFNQTIIIATTNVGNSDIAKLPLDQNFFSAAVHILESEFRTEFLNRFDNIIAFHTLSSDDIREIIKLQLRQLNEKLYQDHKIKLKLLPQTVEWLVTFGYSPEFGARNLKRVLQDSIETKLAQMILKGEVQNGQNVTL